MLNDGTIETIGDTDLTNGQVKKMITERKVIIAHFFDRGNDWHCLFTTYNSIGGKENYNNGQPHYHYFSSAFGIKRDEFIESILLHMVISTRLEYMGISALYTWRSPKLPGQGAPSATTLGCAPMGRACRARVAVSPVGSRLPSPSRTMVMLRRAEL